MKNMVDREDEQSLNQCKVKWGRSSNLRLKIEL